jgi:hypothetical protein
MECGRKSACTDERPKSFMIQRGVATVKLDRDDIVGTALEWSMGGEMLGAAAALPIKYPPGCTGTSGEARAAYLAGIAAALTAVTGMSEADPQGAAKVLPSLAVVFDAARYLTAGGMLDRRGMTFLGDEQMAELKFKC